MRTVVIPRADWRVKLDEFSNAHEGWRVSLELLMPDLGAQPEIADLPLRGVAAELGSKDSTITIAAGSNRLDQITHTIHTPQRVQLEQNDRAPTSRSRSSRRTTRKRSCASRRRRCQRQWTVFHEGAESPWWRRGISRTCVRESPGRRGDSAARSRIST